MGSAKPDPARCFIGFGEHARAGKSVTVPVGAARYVIFAHTAPNYIAVDGEWWLFDHDAAQYMLTLVGGGLSYIRQRALHHPSGAVTHQHGQHDHLAYLERPFHEARVAIQQRASHG